LISVEAVLVKLPVEGPSCIANCVIISLTNLCHFLLVFSGDLWFCRYPRYPRYPGRDGIPGSRGPAGAKGESGERGDDYVDLVKSNWKQCVWKRNDGKDTGLIQV
jgi:hypothetical protein